MSDFSLEAIWRLAECLPFPLCPNVLCAHPSCIIVRERGRMSCEEVAETLLEDLFFLRTEVYTACRDEPQPLLRRPAISLAEVSPLVSPKSTLPGFDIFDIETDLFDVPEYVWDSHLPYIEPYVRASAKGRRRKRGGSRRSRASVFISGVDRVESVPGKVLVQVTVAPGGAPFAFPLAMSNMGPRLVTLGSVFQEHRFVNMQVQLHPAYTTAASAVRASYAVAYFKTIPLLPPLTVANAYSGAISRYHDVGDTVPVRMKIQRGALVNNVRPWFINDSPSGSEVLDATQGVIYVVPLLATGLVVNLEISYVVQLRGATLPNVG